MDKVVRDGKVAVLYSPRSGSGWSTWLVGTLEEKMTVCMDERIVKPFLDGDKHGAMAAALGLFPNMYINRANELRVMWVQVGSLFDIEEYGGEESIRIISDRDYMKA